MIARPGINHAIGKHEYWQAKKVPSSQVPNRN
jgi:hypothetical protein